MKPSLLFRPECVASPGTFSGFQPRRMPSMSSEEDIAALQVRIAKAESERDTWLASRMHEKYLEAYCMVEALELQLDLLRQAARLR